MRFYKIAIRIWITLASLGSFAIGWAALAHAPKPNQFKASAVPAMAALPPVPSIEQMTSDRQFTGMTITQRPTTRLRTSGS
jgi:hypothetical protein